MTAMIGVASARVQARDVPGQREVESRQDYSGARRP
jgi:hypothetical protein